MGHRPLHVNRFAHPYSGNLSFTGASSNGYGFWMSAPFALVGSIVWEYFGERTKSPTSDLVNTTRGGITLGGTTCRLSSLILDAGARGTERLIGELGPALVDPPRAFSRLMDGDGVRDPLATARRQVPRPSRRARRRR